MQQERAAVLAEERANFERLLVAVSTTLNQDLPNKLQASWVIEWLLDCLIGWGRRAWGALALSAVSSRASRVHVQFL